MHTPIQAHAHRSSFSLRIEKANVCMFICMYVHTFVCVHKHSYMYMYVYIIHTQTHTYIDTHKYIYIYIDVQLLAKRGNSKWLQEVRICMQEHECVCMVACVYGCVCVCKYVCVYRESMHVNACS
jgi:hypothetical protein